MLGRLTWNSSTKAQKAVEFAEEMFMTWTAQGGSGKVRIVTRVTTPQEPPPPPRRAKKRSEFWKLFAMTRLPY